MLQSKNCVECNTQFQPVRKSRIYCSKKCVVASWKKNNKEKAKEHRRKSEKKRVKKKRSKDKERVIRMREIINKIKIEKGCSDCGYNLHAIALDFDHIRGVKEFDIAQCRSLPKALEEIKKCEVVCANCHRIRTYNRAKNKIAGREVTIDIEGDKNLYSVEVTSDKPEKVNIILNGELQTCTV